MRLNLPNSECVQFEIRAEFAVSGEVESAIFPIIEQTSHHSHDEEETGSDYSTVGIFGSRFVIGGVSHRAVGNLMLARREGEPRVDVWMMNRAERRVSRPPRTIKPVSMMMEAIAGQLGTESAECSVIFEYPQSVGWSSRIALPIPLILPADASGVTHIEAAEFSRRDSDGIRYRAAVRLDAERDIIVHTIRFQTDIDWTNRSFRNALNFAKGASTQLLVREAEGDTQNGSSSTGEGQEN